MKLISVKIPDAYLEGLEILVRVKKMYPNRSEAIRMAIRDLLRRELWSDKGRSISLPPDLMMALKEDVVKEIE